MYQLTANLTPAVMATLNFKVNVDAKAIDELSKKLDALKREVASEIGRRSTETDTKTWETLIERRKEMELRLIEETHERRKAHIEQEAALEMEKIKRVVEERRQAGEVTHEEARKQLEEMLRIQ